ncbi:hypothetical protein Bca4012_025964 [Brassica carinata]|uniref:Uncharacterized protein n=1 Tax=Brassica carinata TaxID=52824 RepID=A0A8X7VHS8_BRACI|nr:hypothetical protein Bca52824_022993 [Brassica carinata]
MEIQSACALETQIDSLKREATERPQIFTQPEESVHRRSKSKSTEMTAKKNVKQGIEVSLALLTRSNGYHRQLPRKQVKGLIFLIE